VAAARVWNWNARPASVRTRRLKTVKLKVTRSRNFLAEKVS